METSGQDGSIGKHASKPHTTIEKITTRHKTNIIQNRQKIKLYGSPATKDLKKPHSSRQVGGVETWREVEARRGEDPREWHVAAADWAAPHSHVVDKNQEGYLGKEGAKL